MQKLLLLLFLVIFIGGCANESVSVQKNEQSSSQKSIDMNDQHSGWKTYSYKTWEKEFSVQYPADWSDEDHRLTFEDGYLDFSDSILEIGSSDIREEEVELGGRVFNKKYFSKDGVIGTISYMPKNCINGKSLDYPFNAAVASIPSQNSSYFIEVIDSVIGSLAFEASKSSSACFSI